MNIRHIVTLLCACALGAVAGHWHARSLSDTSPARHVSALRAEIPQTRTPPSARLDGPECIASDLRHRSEPQDLVAPALAFERALRQRDAELRFEALRGSFSRLFGEDWARALREAERIPEDERDAIVGPALGAWAKQEPQHAWDALNRKDLAREHRAALFAALAEEEPQRALSWLRNEAHEHDDAPQPIELYRAIVPTLLRDDLSTAAAIVADLGRDPPLDLVQQVASEHAKRNPHDAFAWAADLGSRSDYERIQTLQAVSAGVVAADPEGAATLLNQTTDAQTRHSLMHALAGHKARESVHDAWIWLRTYQGDDAYRENARALLGAWSYAKPREVAAVILEIDDAELQRGAAEQLSNVWRERDPKALRQWIAALPAGPLRDALDSLPRNAGES